MHTGHSSEDSDFCRSVYVCLCVFVRRQTIWLSICADTRIAFGVWSGNGHNGVGQYGCSRVAIHLIVKFITKQVISRRSARARELSLVPRRAALRQQHLWREEQSSPERMREATVQLQSTVMILLCTCLLPLFAALYSAMLPC